MKSNKTMNIGFIILESAIFLIVALFVYIAVFAVRVSIIKYDTSPLMYFPLLLVTLIFPILLTKYYKMFSQGNFLMAFVWLMGTSSFVVGMLYVYIPSLV